MKKLSILIMLSIFLFSSCSSITPKELGTKRLNNGSDNNIKYKTNKYISYENNDGLFKVTLFIEDGVHTSKKHIDIFSTIEYVGNDDSIKIWHGLPYFNYTIFDGEHYYSEGITETILTHTVLKKGQVYTKPFSKSGGWSNNDPDAEYWESYYMDKELKLPPGKYTLVAYCDFGLSEDDLNYENKIEIIFEVE